MNFPKKRHFLTDNQKKFKHVNRQENDPYIKYLLIWQIFSFKNKIPKITVETIHRTVYE
jgi:hypothetical protein